MTLCSAKCRNLVKISLQVTRQHQNRGGGAERERERRGVGGQADRQT